MSPNSTLRHRCSFFETPMGVCGIAWGDRGVARFHLPAKSRAEAETSLRRRLPSAEQTPVSSEIATAAEIAQSYFRGEVTDFSGVAIDLAACDPYHAQIYEALRRVGWGRTTTYGALAAEVGAGPMGARDVGEAMARNPIPLIIPCHRVLAAGGKLGGFSAPGGAQTKLRMLRLEGIEVGPRPTPVQERLAL